MWDRRKIGAEELSFKLEGHADTITSMRLSPDGSYLMSNAMDSSIRIWDVRPFAPTDRCIKTFNGNLCIYLLSHASQSSRGKSCTVSDGGVSCRCCAQLREEPDSMQLGT